MAGNGSSRWAWLGQDPWRWVLAVAGAVVISLGSQEARRSWDRWQLGAELVAERDLQESPLGRAVLEMQNTLDRLPGEIRADVARMIAEHEAKPHDGAVAEDDLARKLDELLIELRRRPP